MHDAIHSNACDSLNFLLENNADSSILNNDLYAPLHLAALLNKVDKSFANHASLKGFCLFEASLPTL